MQALLYMLPPSNVLLALKLDFVSTKGDPLESKSFARSARLSAPLSRQAARLFLCHSLLTATDSIVLFKLMAESCHLIGL